MRRKRIPKCRSVGKKAIRIKFFNLLKKPRLYEDVDYNLVLFGHSQVEEDLWCHNNI